MSTNKRRGTYAYVTLTDNRVTADSTLSIVTKGDTVEIVVMGAAIPERVEHGGRLAPARICAAIAEHGYRPVDYYTAQRKVDGGIEIDVEVAS